MATVINAVDVVIKVDNITVGCLQSMDISVERDMDAATCSDSGSWDEVSPGRMRASGSINGAYREFTPEELATNFGYDDIFDLLTEGTKVNISYGTMNTGKRRYSLPAFLNSVGFSRPESGIATWSSGFQGSGAITHANNA